MIFLFLFLNENICYDPSLEPSGRDSFNKGHNICFYGEIWKIILELSPLSLVPVAQSVKRWSADLAVLGSTPVEAEIFTIANEVPLHTACHYHPSVVLI